VSDLNARGPHEAPGHAAKNRARAADPQRLPLYLAAAIPRARARARDDDMPTQPDYRTPATQVHEVLSRWMLTDGMPLVYDPARSHGGFIVDGRTGEEFLDLFSFFASMPLGHGHAGLADPAFHARILEAALVKPSNSDIYTQPMADFVATFARTLPAGFSHLFFIEGGALAVENAIKVAFDWKVRKNIAAGRCPDNPEPTLGTKVIHFRGAFHGRSGYTLSLTNGFSIEKTYYYPKFPWPRVSTPALRFPLEEHNLASTIASETLSISEIRKAFADNPNQIAAIIIETIQGEGGDNHFRPEFLRALRQLCDEQEALLIFDEIQCGMGMTGKWWAFEHYDVRPDIFSFGKKAQVCGIASTGRVDEVASCFTVPSRINSTWGGNLVDMVRCTRYIEIIEQEKLLDNATAVGAYLLERLMELQASYRMVSNVRGRGLMCAFDLPNTAQRARALQLLFESKVILLPAGAQSIRFRPALDLKREHVDLAIQRIKLVLDKLLF
jgi:L-lysine 6-transaminase